MIMINGARVETGNTDFYVTSMAAEAQYKKDWMSLKSGNPAKLLFTLNQRVNILISARAEQSNANNPTIRLVATTLLRTTGRTASGKFDEVHIDKHH